MSDSTELVDSNMLSPSIGANQNISVTSNAPSSAAADPNAFIKYLKQFVPALLDANNNNSGDLDKCLSDKANVECIKKFLSESHVRTLIIQKFLSSKGKVEFKFLKLLQILA